MKHSTGYYSATAWGIMVAVLAAALSVPTSAALAQGVEIITNLTPVDLEVATLSPGDQYYVDRIFTIVSMPSQLVGAVGIKTANDDKNNSTLNYIEFDLSQAADIHIAYDNRGFYRPDWMSDFTATGEGIAVTDAPASPLQLYKKTFSSGHVVLGGNKAPSAAGADSNYLVLAEVAAVRLSGRNWLEMGQTLNLTAIVTGPVIGALSYQWSKDGGDLTGETNPSLVIAGVDAADEGVYRVTVEDESGDDPLVSAGKDVQIFAVGVLPLAGYLGLGLLAGACALLGAASIRRKKP